ncbi:MAG: hypothetical protein ACK55Z_10295 [bacterium]
MFTVPGTRCWHLLHAGKLMCVCVCVCHDLAGVIAEEDQGTK